MEYPPVNLDFNDNGCIESKVVFKLTHYHTATGLKFQAKDDPYLKGFVEKFRDENPHLRLENIDYWGDGDDGTYYHYVDIYYSTMPWYDEIVSKNIRMNIKGKEYLLWWINTKGCRVMDLETKKTYFFNTNTMELTKY